MELQSLTDLPAGAAGTVAIIQGGAGMLLKLGRLGLRPGAHLRKVGGLYGRGPVLVEVAGTQVALGHGMAGRVLVRPEEPPGEESPAGR